MSVEFSPFAIPRLNLLLGKEWIVFTETSYPAGCFCSPESALMTFWISGEISSPDKILGKYLRRSGKISLP